MSDDKLDSFLTGNSYRDMQKKIDALASPYEHLSEMSTKLSRIIGLSGIVSQFAQIDKYTSLYNSYEKMNGIRFFADSLNHMNKRHDPLQVILGGSTITALARSIQMSQPINKVNTFADLAKRIQDKYSTHHNVFNKQLTITELLSKGYFNANNLAYPSWINKISQTEKLFDSRNVNLFDVLSAETLTRITETIEEVSEEDVNAGENLDQISEVLKENAALKNELENLYLNFAKHIASKLKRRKRVNSRDLKEPSKLLTAFIHKHLFTNTRLSQQAIYTFICLIEYVFTVIFIGLIMEGKGDDIFNKIFSNETETIPQQQAITNNNTYNIVNNYNFNQSDFVINDAKVYLRNSVKTNCIGKIKQNTTILILSQKLEWCFVEAIAEKYDKKRKKIIEKVVRGWIMKKHLDSFQQ